MSVVGFDVGSLRSVVAIARAGGVDVVCNEVSDRSTSGLVSFDSKRRYLGEAAKTQQMSNFRNTVSCLNRFIGRSPAEPDLESEKKYWTCQFGEKDNEAAAVVTFKGEQNVFSSTEIMAMFLGKLKAIAQNESKALVSDCVISVPVFFTDAQRRAMLDASSIAGLNCLRLINDTTATTLSYGLTKNDQFSEKPKLVCFVDIGYSGTKVTVASFTKGNLEIRGSAWNSSLGGRDFDESLVDYFADSIKKTHNEDLKSSPRGLLRLRIACEKIKKVLSGISSTKVDLETESRDYPLHMTREVFEGLIVEHLQNIEKCIQAALSSAGLSFDGVDSVEIVGGSTRIPSIKSLLARLFGKEPSSTMNQDEAVARGCAFQCAIESPSFKVREFGIKDIIAFPLKVAWNCDEKTKEVEVFPHHSNLPSVKPLFLTQQLPIDLQAFYSDLSLVPIGTKPLIGKFTISGTKSVAGPDNKVRLDAGINGHGLFYVKKALIIEERIEEVDGTELDAPKQKKKVIREYELNVTSETASRSPKDLQKMKDSEFALCLNDKYAQELDDSRNSLEEYIYELRAKLEDAYKPFVLDSDSASLMKQLNEAEEWLYSDHESENKEMYLAKLSDLQKIGGPITVRAKEHENRPHAENLLRELINAINGSIGEKNLEDEDVKKIHKECASRLSWLDEQVAKQATLPLYENPSLTVAKINEQREKLLSVTSAILAKAVPKKPEPTPSPSDEAPSSPSCGGEDHQHESPDMEVD